MKKKEVPNMDKKAMYKISYGLFVVTANISGKDNGCITNTLAQVTSEPNRVSLTVNKGNYTHDMIKESGKFTASIISQEADFELFKHFGFQSGRDTDKFAAFSDTKRIADGNLCILKGTNAYISGKVVQTVDLGTHTMFIADVTDMEVLSDVPSATYEYYLSNIKVKPKEVGKTKGGQTIWRCMICGYEYVGEELPEDFICPFCKHPASDFEKVTGSKNEEDAEPVGKTEDGQTIWRCKICGYEYIGEELPEDFECPLCGVPASEFEKVTGAKSEEDAEPVGKTEDGQTIWRCKICGYEYIGDELPEDFECPLCGVPASEFEKVTS